MVKIADKLIGLTFGHLKVIEYDKERHKWKCQCDCGNITYVKTQNLKTGNTKSCGCGQNKIGTKKSRKDINALLKGKMVGQLKVVDIDEEKGVGLCFCTECNSKTIEIPLDKLKEMYKSKRASYTCGLDGCVHVRKTKSNMASANIQPKTKFGKLTVEMKLPNKIVKTEKSYCSIPMYQCKCECGNRIEVQGRYLLSGKTKSCGCLKKKNFDNRSLYKDITCGDEGKALYKIYQRWKDRFANPSDAFKKKVIDKGIKFFPELEDKKESFRLFYQWAIIKGFNSKTTNHLTRIDYDKDFDTKNCFWTESNTRGY